MSNCGKCNEIITAAPDSMKCIVASCGSSFHQRCVGINRSLNTVIENNTNVVFICNPCKNRLIGLPAEDIPKTLADDLSAIKTTLTNLTSIMSKSANAWPAPLDRIGSKSKRTRLTSELEDVSLLPPEEPQNNLKNTVVGTSEVNELRVVETRREIVASMLHPSTEAELLLSYLKEKLCAAGVSSDLRITKLVPAGKDISSLDYISFKVAVPESSFNVLMSDTMWPKGVTVRQFQYRPRKPRQLGNFLPNMRSVGMPVLEPQL